MRGPHNIVRLVRTLATLERAGAIGVVLEAFSAPPRLRVLARVLGWPFAWLGLRGDPGAAAADPGDHGAWSGLHQVRAEPVDPPRHRGRRTGRTLRYLQDQLPPFPISIAKQTIEAELGIRLDEAFSEFSEPVAAASIAQVHRARLADTRGPKSRSRCCAPIRTRLPQGHRRLLLRGSRHRKPSPLLRAGCGRWT